MCGFLNEHVHLDHDAIGAIDDVVVGQDKTGRIDDEASARPASRTVSIALGLSEQRRTTVWRLGGRTHDAARGAELRP